MNSSTILTVFCAAAVCFAGAPAGEAASFAAAERYFADSLFGPALQQYRKLAADCSDSVGSGLERKNAVFQKPSANEITALFKIGICSYRLSEYPAASEAFDEFVRKFPTDIRAADAIYYAANAQKDLGNNKEASDRYFHLWLKFPASGLAPGALYCAAQCAAADGNIDRAAEVFSSLCDRFPKADRAGDAHCALVKLYLEQKDFQNAAKVITSAEKRFSSDERFLPRLLYYRALLSSMTQKNDRAARLYSALLSMDAPFPEKEEAFLNCISFLVGQNDVAATLPVFQRLSDYYQKKGASPTPDFLLAWADNAAITQSLDLAEKLYRQAVAGAKDSAASLARHGLAQCRQKRGALSESADSLASIAAVDSVSSIGRKSLMEAADLYYATGQFPSAIAAYRKYARRAGPGDGDKAALRIADILREKYRRFAAALREYDNFTVQFPETPLYNQALFSMGQCEEALGNTAKALLDYKCILELGGDGAIAGKARERFSYLSSFRSPNLDHAVHDLAELAVQNSESLSSVSRLSIAASIYRDDLHDFPRSIELYRQATAAAPPGADSVRCRLALQEARAYEHLFEKAAIECDTASADSAKNRAVALYNVASRSAVATVADEAAFGIMTTCGPKCAACERFLADHPTTAHRAELHFMIAQFREARADSGEASVRSGAVQAYAKAAAECAASDTLLPRALLGCARNSYALGKNDSADSKLKDFFARFEDSAFASEGYYLRGLVFKSRRLLSEALDQFKKVLDSYPLSSIAGQARYEASTTYLSMGRYEEALDGFRLCARNGACGDRGAEVRLGAARCLLKLSRPDEAAALLLDIARAKGAPSCAGDAYVELSEIAKSKGLVREAVEYCGKAIAIEGYARRNQAVVTLASLYFGNRMYPEAVAAYKRALAFVNNRKDSASVCAGMVSALLMDGQRAEAETASQFFKTHFGVAGDAYSQIAYHEGLCALVSKDYDKARSRFNYILERYPESTWRDAAAYQSALSWFYAGKTDVALDKFNAFLASYPRSSFAGCADFKIGMIYHDQNDFEQASKYFAAALSQLSTDRMTRFRAAYNAAIDLQKLSRWLDAARMYETTIDSFPEEINPSSGFLKTGFCFLQASRYDEALRLFAKASVNPGLEEKPEILYWTATCWARQGELRKAAAEYLKVLALYAGIGRWGLTSECEAARLYEKLGEYKKSLDLYRKIVHVDGETGELGREAASRIEQLSTIAEHEQ